MITLTVTFGGSIATGIYQMYNLPSDVGVLKSFVMKQDSVNKMQMTLNKQFADSIKLNTQWNNEDYRRLNLIEGK